MPSTATSQPCPPRVDSRVRSVVRSVHLIWFFALLCMFVPRLALAHLPVPMCSGNAETIAAPPPESPPSGDELREGPTCPIPELPSWERPQPGSPAPPHTVLDWTELGALFVCTPPRLQAHIAPSFSPCLAAVHFRELPRELYRPPEG